MSAAARVRRNATIGGNPAAAGFDAQAADDLACSGEGVDMGSR